MSLILNLLKALALGVLSFYLFPLAATLLLDWEDARDLVSPWISLGTSTLSRGLLVQRSHGGWELKKTSFDGGVGGEVAKLSGEPHMWRDIDHRMSKWQSATFGLAHEDKDVIVDTRIADLGRRKRDLHDTGRWKVNGRRKAYFIVEQAKRLVNLNDAPQIIPGSASPRLADRLEDDMKKSQALFNSHRGQLVTTIQLLMFFGVGVGTIYVANRLAGTSGSVTSVNLTLQPLAPTAIAALPLISREGIRKRARKKFAEYQDALVAFGITLGSLSVGAALGIFYYASKIRPNACSPFISDCTAIQTANSLSSTTAIVGGILLVTALVINEFEIMTEPASDNETEGETA